MKTLNVLIAKKEQYVVYPPGVPDIGRKAAYKSYEPISKQTRTLALATSRENISPWGSVSACILLQSRYRLRHTSRPHVSQRLLQLVAESVTKVSNYSIVRFCPGKVGHLTSRMKPPATFFDSIAIVSVLYRNRIEHASCSP